MRRLLPGVAIVLTAVAVYAHTLPFDFAYDDFSIIVRNERVHSLAGWREIVANPWWPRGLYRPLTSLTLAADWTAGGGSPFPFHLGNLVAHAAASALVFLLAGAFLPRAAALAAGLLFAVHPVHVEAVANVVGRAEVLATLFTLAAALLYRADGDPGRSGGRRLGTGLGTLAAVLLALASKESAFAAPAILLIVDWGAANAEGVSAAVRFRRHWWLWAAGVAVAVAWLWLRARVLGDLAGDYPAPGLAGTGIAERFALMLPVVPEYLRLLFFPARLSADYSPGFLTLSPSFSTRSATGLAALTAVTALAFAARRKAPVVTLGFAWIGAAVLIISNLLVPSGILLAERTLYLASVGACLAFAWIWGWAHARRPAAAGTVLAILVAAGAGRTWIRAQVWRDNTTFFPQLVRDAPGSFRSDWVAGMLAYTRGDSAAGEALMRRGLAIYSGNGAMWSDFARQMERERRWPEAADYFWNAFTADSTLVVEAARAVANHVQAGQLDAAESRLKAVDARLPVDARLSGSPDLQISASHLALARGDADRALLLRREVAEARPSDGRYWLLTAEAAVRARRCPELSTALGRLHHLRPFPGHVRISALQDSARGLGCDRTPPSP